MVDMDSVAEGNLGPAEDGIPQLLAYHGAENAALVWCRHCQRWHSHGWQGGGGHRAAHCDWESPYSERGYYLVLTDNPLPKMRQARHSRKRPALRK